MSQLPITLEFLEQAAKFREEWYKRYQTVSQETTPQVDGTGKKIIDKRPDGYDYVDETYVRDMLDKHFPGWSWEMAAPLHFLGAEWVVAQGHLIIVDEHLLMFRIQPPIRKFFGVDSVRIQYKKGLPHVPENIVDVGDNCKQANTAALKYATNRLCRIADDVYKKRIEYEGSGSVEGVLVANPDAEKFGAWVTEHHGNWGEIMKLLEVKEMAEVKDYAIAFKVVKEKKGW